MEISSGSVYNFATLKLTIGANLLLVCTLYTPQNLSAETSKLLYEHIRSFVFTWRLHIGGIKWNRAQLNSSNPSSEGFLDAIDDLFLIQHVTAPSRVSPLSFATLEERKGSILCLRFTTITLSNSKLK